jgi:beta-phosphoglucomutase-like phosphatase (HAD superfamily)
MAAPLRALIWDVDGTVAETERDGHRLAFNTAFQVLGLPWRWDAAHYGVLLHVTGGYERLLADMAQRADAPQEGIEREKLARALHGEKNRAYTTLVQAGGMGARPGVQRLVGECQAAGVALAVATTTGTANVDALFPGLFGPDWREIFPVRVCAEDAPAKKPDPLVYTLALQRLGLGAESALALEDSPNGLMAARAAGLGTVVTRGAYFVHEAMAGALAVVPDLDAPVVCGDRRFGRVDLAALRALQAGRA